MPGFHQSLNAYLGPLFEAAVSTSYAPIEYIGLTEGMTGFDSTGDAVELNPPIAGLSRDARRESGIHINLQPQGDRFILRTILGYSVAASYINNPILTNLTTSNIINNMIVAAYKVYGPRIQRLTFSRPDYPNEYIRELEHYAGYEIRLYGELSEVPTQFEQEDVNGTVNGI